MWYVVQTESGNEHLMRQLLLKIAPEGVVRASFIPLYEDVWRRQGVGHISIRRLFPGYFFVDTDEPETVSRVMRWIPEFKRVLAMWERDGTRTFMPVLPDEQAFLDSLMETGLMHVSFIRRTKSGRIDTIIGPLSRYSNRITKLDVPHRRAIVETELFGRHRKIKFGLWTDDDPYLPWLDRILEEDGLSGDVRHISQLNNVADLGIHPGDSVRDTSGVYGDQVFHVTAVDIPRRLLRTTTEMFGTSIVVELSADDVEQV